MSRHMLKFIVAYALVRAASRLVSMLVPGVMKTPASVDTSVDAARRVRAPQAYPAPCVSVGLLRGRSSLPDPGLIRFWRIQFL